jgi:alkanesulfonate monooxygenase SsuD/methylene tetrahydromethanopterin reductase-like flavin-dependent oxidoreductase (luciferase family)
MRLGIVVDQPGWEDAAAEVDAAASAGLDCCWIPEHDLTGTPRSGPATACSLRPHLRGLAPVIELTVGTNPIGLAEEAAVADHVLGGRVVAVLVGDDPELADETLSVLELALASRPFRHEGARWTLPGKADSVLVTPPPAQLVLPVWLLGLRLAEVAKDHGAAWVADESAGAEVVERAALRPRAAVRSDVTIESLRRERDAWGLDLCVVRLPENGSHAERLERIDELGRWIRPQVQGNEIPEALVEEWKAGRSRLAPT